MGVGLRMLTVLCFLLRPLRTLLALGFSLFPFYFLSFFYPVLGIGRSGRVPSYFGGVVSRMALHDITFRLLALAFCPLAFGMKKRHFYGSICIAWGVFFFLWTGLGWGVSFVSACWMAVDETH